MILFTQLTEGITLLTNVSTINTLINCPKLRTQFSLMSMGALELISCPKRSHKNIQSKWTRSIGRYDKSACSLDIVA
jgi:hypothetical protein